MARTTNEIQQQIHDELTNNDISLSTSKTAEWRIWTWVIAMAINLFEVILDLFKAEVDEIADKVTPGTARWYAEQCRRFQNGHELLFNSETTELYYETEDEDAQIVDIVAVTEGDKTLSIKVAKLSSDGEIEQLDSSELYNFTGYIDCIKFAGIQTTCISTTADQVRYNAEVYYSPSVPLTQVEASVQSAIDNYRQELDFDSMFYSQKFIAAIMAVNGVVTVDLKQIEKMATLEEDFSDVVVVAELAAGYFDYTDDCVLTFKSTSDANI